MSSPWYSFKKKIFFQTSNREIQDSNRQIVQLRENVVTLEERTKQLQIEKEKFVSDIITMRKLLKEKEK